MTLNNFAPLTPTHATAKAIRQEIIAQLPTVRAPHVLQNTGVRSDRHGYKTAVHKTHIRTRQLETSGGNTTVGQTLAIA